MASETRRSGRELPFNSGLKILALFGSLAVGILWFSAFRLEADRQFSATLEVKGSLHAIAIDVTRLEDIVEEASESELDDFVSPQAQAASVRVLLDRIAQQVTHNAEKATRIEVLKAPLQDLKSAQEEAWKHTIPLVPNLNESGKVAPKTLAEIRKLLVLAESGRARCFDQIEHQKQHESNVAFTALFSLIAWFAVAIGTWVRPTLKSFRNALHEVELQRAVLAQRETELDAYRTVLDRHSIVATTDNRGRILSANEKFILLSGYSLEELIGSDHRLINSGHHSRQFWSELYRTIHRGEVWTGTIKNRAKDGTYYWVNTSIGPKINASGEVTGFIAVRTDVTAEKVAESLISEAYQRIERITDHIPGAVFQWKFPLGGNPETVFVSPKVADLLGVTPQALQEDFSLWTQKLDGLGNQLDAVGNEWGVDAFHSTGLEYEFEILHPSKGKQRLSIRTSFERDPNGDLSVFGFLSDVSEKRRIEEQIRELGERFSLVQKTIDVGVWDWQIKTNRLDWDDEMFRIYGVSPDEFNHSYNDWAKCCQPGEADRIQKRLEEAIARDAEIHDAFRIQHPTLGERHISIDAVAVKDRKGELERIVGLNFDITEKVQIQATLNETEERYRLALAGSNDGVWDWDIERAVVVYSARWREIMGLTQMAETAVPEVWLDRTHPEDAPVLVKEIGACLTGDISLLDIEHRILHGNGFYRWVHVRGICLHTDGKPKRFVGSISDIHGRKLAEEALREAATTDRLTGLPNRDSLYKSLDAAIDRSRGRKPFPFALMFLDFDRFKVINDSLGHEVGDAFLIAVAHRLRDLINGFAKTDGCQNVVSRLAGDEFVILVDNCDQDRAIELSELVLEVLSAPIDVQGNTLYATASIGIVTDKQLDLAKGTEGALADADLAMYTAKSNGKNRVALFDESLRTQVQHRLELEQDLRKALYFGEFSMKYQPIMSLSEGNVASFEALIRWQSPSRGFVSPADFIPVAEESGLIIGLGDWVMEEVCRQILEWQAVHPEKRISVSINVSRKQLMLPLFAERVEHLVRGMGIEPELIHLEVTESALMANTEIATNTLKQLRDAGFHIDLDDFGTGYTSLADLDNFPLDVIKIDKSFVDDLTSGGRSMEVIRAVRTLGDAIGASIIAEGVETQEQLRILYYMGIEMVQGYLISKPLDPDDAILFEYDLGAQLRTAA